MQIIAGIILLGVLIAFHELGHFLFAKWLGVRVLVFSIGFGPKIWGFKKGDTEYRLSAIPLGGYVRMFGESLEEELSPPEKQISFMHQPIWRKSLIAFAGPLFNFILPVILFFFLLVGVEQVFAPRVGTLVKDGVAERAGILPGDLIVVANGQPVESFNQVADIIANSPGVDVVLRVQRKKNESSQTQEIDLTVKPEAKSLNHPLEKDESTGRIGIMPAIELPIVMVSDVSPFKKVGLKSFDEITKVGTQTIDSISSLLFALKNLRPDTALTIKRGENEELTIKAPGHLYIDLPILEPEIVQQLAEPNLTADLSQIEKTKTILKEERQLLASNFGLMPANGGIEQLQKGTLADQLSLAIEDKVVSINGEPLLTSAQLQQALTHGPTAVHVLGIIKKDGSSLIAIFSLPKGAFDQINLSTDLVSIFGIGTAQAFKPGEVIKRRVGVMEALSRATEQTIDIAWMTAKSLWLLISGKVPASQIGGPIMLFDVAKQAAEKGLSYYIFIMCLLSVNLGLLNLLPIPALDGGHLLLFGIEAVQRKPLTAKTRAIATQIGIALLLLLMAFAIFNDLSRLFG